MTAMARVITTAVRSCARCGGNHEPRDYQPLQRPMEPVEGEVGPTWTHWALCPTTGEPVLMTVADPGTPWGPKLTEREAAG